MRLIVTRPLAQALPAVQELRAHGVDAHALPLIGIEALPDNDPLADALSTARATLARRRLVMFVSANAVAHFFAAPGYPAWPAGTLAGSTGPGTSAALRAAGVPAACLREPAADAERLDTEALWQQLRALDWRGASVLVVRGEGGRDWLAETLRGAGANVDFVTAYRRTLPRLDAAQAVLLEEAQANPAGHAWHFTSSEAVQNLPRLTADSAGAWRASTALVTHPRIGEAARAIGFAHLQALAPGLAALLRAWQALVGAAAGNTTRPGEGAGDTTQPAEGRR
ncbi:MAG: uroporphyrinogen-III synthase [Rubrivivax sp.]|nr:uroporphyrinogen-III synthase [Rubrivivax sp.]